ncbi:MAG TPA: YegS/Rv2252/BmrU family lipid kinase [Segetibacter sp.]|nr:YegS/Rv2252/BmrU family lipid kinase [Segetibacter sp.]
MPCTFLFVINPVSGGKQKKEHEAAIHGYFQKLPHKIEFFLLNGKNDAEQLDACIMQVKPQKVVAVGGDGTVGMVAKKILGTDMQLGIIPAGSANGMARELNISQNIDEALNTVEKGIVRKADAICINNEICMHLSDIGINARLIKYFEEGNRRGILGYAKVALKALLKKQNIRVIIQAKEKEIKRDAFMVVLANASKYGTGAVINPKGDLYDGLFEVVIIRQLGIATLLKAWFRPQSFDPKKIEVIQAKAVHIETHRRVDFQVDGEYKGKVHIVDAEILPGQLNIVLPE